VPRGNCAGCGRAHIGEVSVVQQQGVHQAGLGGEQDHQAVEAGQADLGVVEETWADLDRETIEARDIRRLHVDLAMRIGDVHGQDRRHDDLAARQGAEGLLNDIHGGRVQMHAGAQVAFGEHEDITHYNPLIT
jgi:hypothetical protein